MYQYIYKTALVLHITGIVLFGGAIIIDYLVTKHFWSRFAKDKPAAQTVFEILSRLQRVMGVGLLLVILSGVGMMVYVHTVYGQQAWFRIKISLVLIVITAGLGFRRSVGTKIEKLLSGQTSVLNADVIKSRLNLLHISLFVLLLGIFVLSVFKFN